jgi:hypothetical protein
VLFELVVGLLVVGAIRARNLRTLGRVLAEERPGRALRRAGASAFLLGVFVLVLCARADVRVVEFAGLLLVPALGLIWLGCGFEDAVLGESGVQRGWSSRRFDELEEWRFADERFCFRLQGEWTDVPCPKALQDRLALPR